MNKRQTPSSLAKIVQKEKAQGKTVGLITGCFDILHVGHVQLFRFAKTNVDTVIVGVENDETIRISKGNDRPFHTIDQRLTVLEELQSIDYLFVVREIFNIVPDQAEPIHIFLTKTLSPTHLITNSQADKFWMIKQQRTHNLGIDFLDENIKNESSSTSLLKHLQNK